MSLKIDYQKWWYMLPIYVLVLIRYFIYECETEKLLGQMIGEFIKSLKQLKTMALFSNKKKKLD